MAGYIVLCDHNIEWQEKFRLMLSRLGVGTICVESMDEIETYMDDAWFMGTIVCSLIELNEYLNKCESLGKRKDSLFNRIDVFVIADKRNDRDEINAFKEGCADFQLRDNNINVILQRLVSMLEKKIKWEKILIDIENMLVIYKDITIEIKDNEAKFLKILSESEEKYTSVEKICEYLWKNSDKEARVRLASLIYRLRKKMPNGGKCIRSIYGKGYYLSNNEIQRCV